MPRPSWRTPLLALALWLSVPDAAVAQKTDVVELANGDRISCEIQKLQRGEHARGRRRGYALRRTSFTCRWSELA